MAKFEFDIDADEMMKLMVEAIEEIDALWIALFGVVAAGGHEHGDEIGVLSVAFPVTAIVDNGEGVIRGIEAADGPGDFHAILGGGFFLHAINEFAVGTHGTGGEQGDDGDDDQQFDQGEAPGVSEF